MKIETLRQHLLRCGANTQNHGWWVQFLVEMHEDHPKEDKQRLFIRVCPPKESATVTCVFAEPGRQAEEWGGFIVGKKGRLQIMR